MSFHERYLTKILWNDRIIFVMYTKENISTCFFELKYEEAYYERKKK